MTPDDVRRLALALPATSEVGHMDHPDFRVRGKIFATLRPEVPKAVVKLGHEQQEVLTSAEPTIFTAADGPWGRQGWTDIDLQNADEAVLSSALRAAWRNVAPKRLVSELERSAPDESPEPSGVETADGT